MSEARVERKGMAMQARRPALPIVTDGDGDGDVDDVWEGR